MLRLSILMFNISYFVARYIYYLFLYAAPHRFSREKLHYHKNMHHGVRTALSDLRKLSSLQFRKNSLSQIKATL